MPLNRRDFLNRSSLAAVSAAVGAGRLSAGEHLAQPAEPRIQSNKNPPNIVYVIVEDCGPDWGCYGTPLVRTPNLDRLAAQSVRFNQAFCSAPVCSASRSALMTGCYANALGAQHHRTWPWRKQSLPPPVRHVCDWFRAAGYYTCNLQPPPEERVSGQLNGARGHGKLDLNFKIEVPRERDPFDGYDWNQRRPDQPFFAHVTLFETHKYGGWKKARERPEAELVNPDALKLPPYYPDHPIARDEFANYLDAIHLADECVGQLWQRLQSEGLSENTILVISSDHGQCLFRSKQFVYDSGLRIPLLVRFPDGRAAGTVDEQLVSGVDIAPTLLGFAGIVPPADAIHGHDVFDPSSKPRHEIFASRDRMDMAVDRMRAVRTSRFKYIRNDLPGMPYMQANPYKEKAYPTWNLVKALHRDNRLEPDADTFAAAAKPMEELYDVLADPHELHNLADQSTYADTLIELRHKVEDWCDRYDQSVGYESIAEIHRGYWGYYPGEAPTAKPNYGP